MSRLQPALLASGVPLDEIQEWTSHVFRRGSGIDVLEERGVAALLQHGDWSDKRAAEPYASADEQAAVSQAAACSLVDLSDDDA